MTDINEQAPSIFTRIIKREIPAHIIWEDHECIAFLDINPFTIGHTLVVPKTQVDQLFDLNPQSYARLWGTAQKVAKQLKNVLKCTRVVVMVLGYEIPHAHIHLIPTNEENEALSPTRPQLTQTDFVTLAERIQSTHSLSTDSYPRTIDIQERWNQFAHHFTQYIEPVTLQVARAALEHLELDSLATDGHILEVGCGGGKAAIEIFEKSPKSVKLTITDISEVMLNIARDRIHSTQLPIHVM